MTTLYSHENTVDSVVKNFASDKNELFRMFIVNPCWHTFSTVYEYFKDDKDRLFQMHIALTRAYI